MIVLSLAWAYAGLSVLALVMHRHHRQVWASEVRPEVRWLWRSVGAICLGASLAACAVRSGWAIALVEWLAVLTVSGLVLVLLLAYTPRLVVAGNLLVLPISAIATVSIFFQ